LATDRLRHRRVVRQIDGGGAWENDWFAPPETKLAAQQDLDVIEAALAQLSPRCREAFLLTRLTDLGTEEIARRVGVSARTVREYVMQAVVHCRRSLDAAHAVHPGDMP